MATVIKDFEEYENMYQRIISTIRFDEKSRRNKYLYDTSKKNPLSYEDTYRFSGNQLCINPQYYKRHVKEIEELVVNTMKSTTQDSINITDSSLVTKEVLDAIIQNPNIKIVTLPKDKYISKEDRERLLKGINHLNCFVDFEKEADALYEYVPGLTISNYPTIAGVTVENFGNSTILLKIDEYLEESELTLLKNLFEKFPKEKTVVSFERNDQIKEVLSAIVSNSIFINNKSSFTKEDYQRFEEITDNKVSFLVGFQTTATPKQLREREEILDTIVEEVKAKDLSPLEEYMYLYNVTKLFKEYKEVPENLPTAHSRQSEFTLFNEYMVCVGYAELLEKLVSRLGNSDISTVTYNCIVQAKEGPVGHTRCITMLKDEKYRVKGTYISDPTWDAVKYYEKYRDEDGKIQINLEKPTAQVDLYSHFLMTKKEMLDENEEYAEPDITDVLFQTDSKFKKEEILDYTYRKAEWAVETLFLQEYLEKEECQNLIDRIGKNQKPISKETLSSAITNLYSKIYQMNNDKIRELVEDTMHYNDVKHQKNFKRTKHKFSDTTQEDTIPTVIETLPPSIVSSTTALLMRDASIPVKTTSRRTK